jgi:hypothetical protein
MNLGVEYFIRTGTIQNFLQVPCSLFAEHWHGGKLIISLEKKPGRAKSYRVFHYHLHKLAEDGRFPASEEHEVLKEKVFESNKTVLRGEVILLSYAEQPVDNRFNRYNHPMDERAYNQFINRYLFSDSHKLLRERWLWKAFVYLHIKAPILTRNVVSFEQDMIQKEEPEKWMLWTVWRRKFLRSTKVAPELIFYPAYY